ncbi:nose resistant to fluoxetine protein 6 [Nilaparvata lugens]|uniref:nose resistant to fluoxetine protein 6 n=1 Tax=Nilaparvata lugens TaxID=108931 RepID=UPI00193E082E|nr:nose resistant to fluoxetine protein 6 [Nilaparvata lugens]
MQKALISILIILALAGSQSAISDDWNEKINTTRLQKYLLETTIDNHNRSTKFIVDTLWIGLKGRKIGRIDNRSLTSSSNRVECLEALNDYVDAVLKGRELWALEMYDASSSVQPGFLSGNIQDMGCYDECVAVTKPSDANVIGKYCTVVVDSGKPFIVEKSISQSQVTYGLCIPSVCHADLIQDLLNGGAVLLNHTLAFKIDEQQCYTRNKRSLGTLDWFAISIFGLFASLAIIATLIDVRYVSSSTATKTISIIHSFSLQKNVHQLLKVSTSRDSMNCLYGLRFMMIVWIICVHRFSQLRSVPAMSMFQHHILVQDWTRAAIVNAYISVDTFFVISGTLLSYSFARKIDKYRQSFSVLKLYLHRYFRITPALAGIVLVYASVSDLWCEGPLYKPFYDSIKKPCMKNWWTTLLYINNYYDSDVMCVVQSWYLSVDMQLYVFISFIHLCMYTFVFAFFRKYEDHRIFLDNYVLTHTRAGSWILGFALGVYLDEFKRNPKVLPKKLRNLGWLLCVLGLFAVIFGILPFQQADHEYSELWDTLFKCLHRHIWAMSICWLIFACSTGHGGFVNAFLSWGAVMQPLGKLTYCIYLVHILILKVQMCAQRTPANFSDITRVTIAFGDVIASMLLAVIFYLLIEAPWCSLERIFLGSEGENTKVRAESRDIGLELTAKSNSK